MAFFGKELRGARAKKAEPAAWKPLMRRVGISAGAALAVFAALLALAAGVCLAVDLARDKFALIILPLAGLSAALAGYLNVRPAKKQALPLGLLAAAAFYTVLLLAAMLFTRTALGFHAVLLLLVCLLGGAAGGVFAVNRAEPQHRRAKVRRR